MSPGVLGGMGEKQFDRRISIKIDADGNVTTVTDSKDIANTFNSHYTTVAEKIVEKRKFRGKRRFHAYLRKPNPLSCMIKPTTLPEIWVVISKIYTSKKLDRTSYHNN